MAIRIPKTAASAVDLAWALSQKRRVLENEVKALKEQESALEAFIKESFLKDGIESLRGRQAVAALSRYMVPSAKNWDQVWAHIKKTGDFDLLQKRISTTAWRERYNAGKPVPGIEPVQVVDITVKAAKEIK